MSQAALNAFLTRPSPISLSEEELGGAPVTRAEEPPPVEAWVRFPETPVRVSGRAVAWTSRAVLVEFVTHEGATRRAWVWASAVDRPS